MFHGRFGGKRFLSINRWQTHMKARHGTAEMIKAITVRVKDTLRGTPWINSRVSEGFKSFMSCANGHAMSTNWLTWRTLVLPTPFFCTAYKRITPASAFDVYKCRSSYGRTCMINDASGSGKDNGKPIARRVEYDTRSDLLKIRPVWICMPHASVMMQLWQSTKDLEEGENDNEDGTRKMKSALAEVLSQIPINGLLLGQY